MGGADLQNYGERLTGHGVKYDHLSPAPRRLQKTRNVTDRGVGGRGVNSNVLPRTRAHNARTKWASGGRQHIFVSMVNNN